MRILRIAPALQLLGDDTGLDSKNEPLITLYFQDTAVFTELSLSSVFSFFLVSFFLVKYLNAHTGIVFLRFPRRCYRLLWSALPFITSVETRGQKIPCFLNCLHVGGKKNINTRFTMNQTYLLTILNIN